MLDNIVAVLQSTLGFIWEFLIPHGASSKQSIPVYIIESIAFILKSYLWFMIVGMVVYFGYLKKKDASLVNAVRYLLPARIYTHRSFLVDLSMVPVAWFLTIAIYSSLVLGAGAVQIWLLAKFGPLPWSLEHGAVAILLQITFTLLGADIARFAWHYQAHFVPFFWEFHKGHHSPEVLHPVMIRTHPVDMIIRLGYMQVGGGILGGGLMYLCGINASATAASYMVVIAAMLHILQMFEHSHVPISFGKTLDLLFYSPHYHPFHHSALPQHRNKNLGITGGLVLWDKLFGTLHVPEHGEMDEIVYGSTLRELGDNNPHRTLLRFLASPFIAAARTLRSKPRKGNTLLPENQV